MRQRKIKPSGSEELFTDFVYGSGIGKQSSNCYAFAIDWLGKDKRKLQPGELSGTLKAYDDNTDPKILKAHILADLKTKKNGGYITTPGAKCKPGYYKIMAFADPGVDYHFYRQVGDAIIDTEGKSLNTLSKNMNVAKKNIDLPPNSNKVLVKNSGIWAHKRGLSELTVKDASGKYILDPRKADRSYGDLDYKQYVGTFCVHKDFGKGQDIMCK